jgi:hypothetical protein
VDDVALHTKIINFDTLRIIEYASAFELLM